LVLDAQKHGEPVAWITALSSSFFPPDVAEGGVDLEALAVVRVPEPAFVPRAADKLARSGAFGLLVLDLFSPARSRPGPGVPSPLLSRLLGLAQRHDIAVVFLTCPRAGAPSLGSLISLRGEVRRAPSGPDRYQVEVQVLKDKRQAPGWAHTELCRGPVGLR
jgi:recombination protein RecA